MSEDSSGAPTEHRQVSPGWGERLALWGLAAILSLFVHVFLRLALEPLAGRHAARAVAKGLSMAILFQVGSGDRSIRAFCEIAAVCLIVAAGMEWL